MRRERSFSVSASESECSRRHSSRPSRRMKISGGFFGHGPSKSLVARIIFDLIFLADTLSNWRALRCSRTSGNFRASPYASVVIIARIVRNFGSVRLQKKYSTTGYACSKTSRIQVDNIDFPTPGLPVSQREVEPDSRLTVLHDSNFGHLAIQCKVPGARRLT